MAVPAQLSGAQLASRVGGHIGALSIAGRPIGAHTAPSRDTLPVYEVDASSCFDTVLGRPPKVTDDNIMVIDDSSDEEEEYDCRTPEYNPSDDDCPWRDMTRLVLEVAPCR